MGAMAVVDCDALLSLEYLWTSVKCDVGCMKTTQASIKEVARSSDYGFVRFPRVWKANCLFVECHAVFASTV